MRAHGKITKGNENLFKECVVKGCKEKVNKGGLCKGHIEEIRIYGTIRGNSDSCIVEGCNESVFCRGFCKRHYHQFNRTGTIVKL